MDLQKLNVKFFVEQPNDVPLADFIDIFHGWIQTSDGIYHDVADYSHMHTGPGIVLVADDANVSIDETGGRRGLLYNRKTPLSGTPRDKLHTVLASALEYCRRLVHEPKLKGKLDFRFDEVEVIVNDRLAVPNEPDSFEALKPDLIAVGRRLFDTARFELHRNEDPGRRFSVTLRALEPAALGTLAALLLPPGTQGC